jgi:RNA polymerase sigma-70 factor (ECF subfamily)
MEDNREDNREALVETVSHGDKPAIDKLFERHLAALRTHVRLRSDSLLRSHDSCSDIVQSVCCDVLEHLADFDYHGEDEFEAMLLRKATFTIIDRLRYLTRRKRDVRREVPLDSSGQDSWITDADAVRRHGLAVASPPQVAIRHEMMEKLDAAFARLPEEQQKVFVMSKMMGMSHDAIARSMGKTSLAIRSLLHRAFVRLGRILSGRVENAEQGDVPSPFGSKRRSP